jgi:asparagine synthase (glutamine-hydrolysing)
MCGITGFWRPSGLSQAAEDQLLQMSNAIRNRGPDAGGSWLDATAGIALGHRRLSIIDLSAAGAQPMHSANGRYIIAYNGEIYNFREIRKALEAEGRASSWKGNSDTEVLLAAIAAWGVVESLKRFNGMFAIALWDRTQGVLYLARDRMGEKPLYVGWMGEGVGRTLVFGSDLASLRKHPEFRGTINSDAVALLTRYLHIPDPHSIYREVEKILPGTVQVYSASGCETLTYWNSLNEHYQAATTNRFAGSLTDAVDELQRLLGTAVSRQSISDVPLGTFLSGGIDSSIVTALLQEQHTKPVKTFSIGFSVAAYDESSYARAVAKYLGTDHHELIVTPEQAMDVIPNLANIYSEPFADSSQIPTFLVSQMAREHVTVALSGDAGDEMFGGYNRYVYGAGMWPRLKRIPAPFRKFAATIMLSIAPSKWDFVLGRLFSRYAVGVGEKLHKAASVIGVANDDMLYHRLLSISPEADSIMAFSSTADGFEGRAVDLVARLDFPERMMALDSIHYLPGDILTKVDRAAMAVSLETRIPMLDVDVMRFAWSLPQHLKIADGRGKLPLRQLLARHLPENLFERPKQGFGIPIDHWLRSNLRDWAEALLTNTQYPLSEFFVTAEVRTLWEAHLSGRCNHQHAIWPILMFQAWRQQGN